jgi:hypothetical protein
MGWHTAKGKVVGTSHAKTDKPCQDAYFVNITKEALTIAVSDGMGSAAYSDKGSEIAARAAALAMQGTYKQVPSVKFTLAKIGDAIRKLLRTAPPADPIAQETIQQRMTTAFAIARSRILEHADAAQHSHRDYACTLLLVVVTKDAWYTMHVGDGAIVGYLTPEQTKTLSEPENGEYVNTTTPLTSSTYSEQMRFHSGTDQLTAVAVLTDGIQQLCINQKTRHSFDPFFSYVLKTFRVPTSSKARDQLVKDFLCSQPVREKCDDDLTLVVAWRSTATHAKKQGDRDDHIH